MSLPEVESSTADEFPKVRERVESQLSSTGIKFGMGGQIGFLFVAAGFLATGLSLAHLVLAGGLWTLSQREVGIVFHCVFDALALEQND